MSINLFINLLYTPLKKIHYSKNNSIKCTYHELMNKPMTGALKGVIQIMPSENTRTFLIEKKVYF